MARSSFGAVVRHIHMLAGAAAARRLTDLHLLRRFADDQDEDAFAEIMRRHGPLVLSVCRRVLGHEQDAEDAFQAAFLVLARKAGSIRKGESVGSFLYGVAYRIAMKERGKLARRRQREQPVERQAPAGPLYEAAFHELQMLLDEGVNHLPEKYRIPFVLCCLEGKSKSEAALELGWKEGTVSSRLAHARKELQQFLARKGVNLAAALMAAGIADNAASACVPPLLTASALRAATLFASGSSAMMETAKAVQLADAVLRSMAALPWKTATTILMVASLAIGGAGMAYHAEPAEQAPASEPPKSTASAARKPAHGEEKPHTDRYGDPLPEGALARFGTIRFRQGYLNYQAVYSPDGKTIACAAAGRGLCLWDAATGKELRCFGEARVAFTLAFSPDGKMLVSDVGGPVALFDVASGKMLAPLTDVRNASWIAFAPDGKAVAVAQNTKGFGVWNIDGNVKTHKRFGNEEKQTTCVAFSREGMMLATGGADKIIYLWDPTTGKELGRLIGHEKEVYRLAFSADGHKLISVSPEDSLRLWDATERRLLRVLDGKHGYSKTAAFSPDGKILASGHGDGTLVLWDADSGKELRCWPGHSRVVQSVEFSPDGSTLLSSSAWECGPRQWDVATGTEKGRRDGHHAPIDALTFSSDGKSLLTQGRDKLFLSWELESGRPHVRFDRFRWMTDHYELSPRGDTAATWSYKDDVIRLWDVATNKERDTLGKFPDLLKRGRFFVPMTFSPDGRLLAFGGTADHEVIIWDVASGKERQRCKGLRDNIVCVAFSPDSKRIAAGVQSISVRPTLAVWDVASGAKGADFASGEPVESLAFSPDGRMLASSMWRQGRTRLWDVESGRELRPLAGAVEAYGLAFSRDGKWLAAAGADHDQKIHVWEVNTGQEVRCFSGHFAGATTVAFAPDNRSLASGGADSTVLLWDVTGRMKDGRLQNVKWTAQDLEKRWINLAGVGPQAVQALWDLVASPEQAVPLLRQRIKPAEPADAQRVDNLIRDLDSDEFQTRTKATEQLEKIVDGAEPALRKKLAEKPSLEMRQRIQQILSKLEPSASAERLRALRAIQVLEYVGTTEAREHLRTLAKGLPEARLTREAKAALERLAK